MMGGAQILYSGFAICCLVSFVLALQAHFHPECQTFARRFFHFLWRYAFPAWLLLKLIERLVIGHFPL
jgi:hypothetical protein